VGEWHRTLEKLGVNTMAWAHKSAFVTGHTGFKGGWLSLALASIGARVSGFALAPPTDPSLFEAAGIADTLCESTVADIRDLDALRAAMQRAAPEVVFHLAAQPLVRQSYSDPIETYAVNVMGTANLLEAVRACPTVKAVVIVTTDKCYQNNEWHWGYREDEPLGGYDPYSSSKACAELVTAAYRSSFLAQQGVLVASARAGNVIGGGDWAADRLLPDYFRAADKGKALEIRSPDAVRPWQHVLEPVMGYMALAEALLAGRAECAEAWNFGPSDDDARPVRWILDELTRLYHSAPWVNAAGDHPHEAHLLKLDSSKAKAKLGWRPVWSLATAVERSVDWHRYWRDGGNCREKCLAQIADYRTALAVIA
jgi:CDP-glucose 4,6-dehydratase